MSYNYASITEAKDKKSGNILKASQVFRKHKTGFQLRKQYAHEEVDLYCTACEQQLTVAYSKLDNSYFRHMPNSGYCELKDESLDEEVIIDYYQVLRGQESFRHKELKNKIGKALQTINGVELSSIVIDTQFITRGNERRRPDVYCKYQDKELVFEIQLSPLSLKYITHRFKFYQKHGIYLFWILDNKNPLVIKQMERDIKYLSTHQNLFAMDEVASSLKFLCFYKTPFLQHMVLMQKWQKRSVGLQEISFSGESVEAYYYDYEGSKETSQQELSRLITKEKAERKAKELQQKQELSEKRISAFVEEIIKYKKFDFNFYQLRQHSFNFDADDIHLLNQRLDLARKTKNDFPALNYYIRTYKVRNPEKAPNESFVEFLIREDSIVLEVNKLSPDGRSCLQELYENSYLHKKMWIILPALFKRGYRLSDSDRTYLEKWEGTFEDKEENMHRLNYLNSLYNRSLAPMVTEYFRYLLLIEAALEGKIICSNLKSWVQYIMPMLSRFGYLWYYSKLALKKNGTWDLILANDAKGTFYRKIQEFDLESNGRDYIAEPLLMDLYPELFLHPF